MELTAVIFDCAQCRFSRSSCMEITLSLMVTAMNYEREAVEEAPRDLKGDMYGNTLDNPG